jgi:DUF2993 family protein
MRRLAVLGVLGVLLLVLVAAQLVLPGIAAQRLRDELSRIGSVRHVEVRAFPAIELLWHQADRVVIQMDEYRSSGAHLASALAQSADVDTLDASAATVTAGLLTLHEATLHKRGSALTGSARIEEADLRRAVPFLTDVQPVASAGDQLVLRGTASLLGVSATADATVTADRGRILVTPQVPFGGLATVTVFSSSELSVDSLSATPVAGGFTVSASGRIR